jgi:hypothetical protein
LHFYPEWLFLLLKGTNRQLVRSGAPPILGREPKSPYQSILPLAVSVLRPLLEDLPNYTLARNVRAFDPSFQSGKPRHCGRRPLIDLLEWGIDEQVNRREAEKAKAELNDPRTRDIRTRQIVRNAKARRTQ